MPGRQGFCWCLGGSRPPEIKYGMDFDSPPKPLALDTPMPTDENELNAKFEELVAELDLDKPHRDALYSLPPEKKWQIYCSKKRDDGSSSQPDYYIERISAMSPLYPVINEEDVTLRIKLVENLKTALRTQPMSFVVRFIEQNGLQCLVDYLCKMDYQTSESGIHTSIIGCIKALMNNSQGRAHVLAHPSCIDIIAQSLRVENIKTKVAVLEILGAVCLVPGGHRKVLDAMLHYQSYAGERARFQTLICDLDRTVGKYREEVSLKTAIMSFINAAINYGAGQDHLEFRLHLRYEFLMLGIQPILDKLKQQNNDLLNRHIDFFEMVRNKDEEELSKRFEGVHVDTKSATAMFEVLRKKLALSVAYPHFLSLLEHLLLLPYGKSDMAALWTLIDKVVQQIVLQRKANQDPDAHPMEINIKQIVHQLTSDIDIKAFQQKLRELEKANEEVGAKLAKRERECETRLEEKEELMSTVNKMKTKLEKEMANMAELQQQLDAARASLTEATTLLETERGEKHQLQHLVKTGSLPDDAKVDISLGKLAGSDLGKLADGSASLVRPTCPPPPPPPPPPAPAPPPPPGAPAIPSAGSSRKRNIPQSKQALKSFNWVKLPDNKVQGTVWSGLEEGKIFKSLDLDDFERTFSAYQRHSGEDGVEDLKKAKTQVLTVIDGRRAQNCTILLSKLKLSNEEIARAVMTMDDGEDLPKDMVEQLLKFVPGAEETQLLSEHSHEIDSMARADRFLYEMSKIVHYEQRLKALFFKKKFQERKGDIKQKIEGVLLASKEVFRSRKLKRLLEVVLAFGNYMNRGQRGNAAGFRVESLTKIPDTKSSLNKSITLLHYLVETMEKKFPEVAQLEEDLAHVHEAAKVNLNELDQEMKLMKAGLQEIEKEVDFIRSTVGTSDKFVTVMSNFCTVALYSFQELEEAFVEMKQKYETAIKAFGEDPKQMQPDEFFGVFDGFLTAFTDAKQENLKFKRMKEEEEKRAKLEEQLKKEREKRTLIKRGSMTPDSKNHNKVTSASEAVGKGEFDDLISALQTGDVFGEDLAKMKRNRRRVAGERDFSRERVGKLN